ncbi:hypothetical protein B0H16DRAFT_1458332 [Mycena metata]|uniref:Uncharacterized protein n=1 Tax=Mycena metata TaxID=1033252 RepID=A0AAD7J3S2_9AGAR|nr:hypothetical protein B0H16DRAFT_1458332 [Mycena metata]
MPNLNVVFSSSIGQTLNLNAAFSSVRFRFKPIFEPNLASTTPALSAPKSQATRRHTTVGTYGDAETSPNVYFNFSKRGMGKRKKEESQWDKVNGAGMTAKCEPVTGITVLLEDCTDVRRSTDNPETVQNASRMRAFQPGGKNWELRDGSESGLNVLEKMCRGAGVVFADVYRAVGQCPSSAFMARCSARPAKKMATQQRPHPVVVGRVQLDGGVGRWSHFTPEQRASPCSHVICRRGLARYPDHVEHYVYNNTFGGLRRFTDSDIRISSS